MSTSENISLFCNFGAEALKCPKPIYTAPTEDEALFALEEFSEKWNGKYPIIAKSWTANWQKINPMFSFPQEIRRAIYTTNVIESLNFSLRKITKTRAAFPTEEAAIKLIWLGLQNIEKNGQCRFRPGVWQ